MEELNYRIIAPEMVWQWYYDQTGGKHFKELLGKEARIFIRILASKKEIFIEDILPQLKELNADHNSGVSEKADR